MPKHRTSPKGMRAFVKQLLMERHQNPPTRKDTLRHGLFYKLIPKIERWVQEQGIDIDVYNDTHEQNFGIAVYKTMSSVLSQMVLDGETSYEHLMIIETERQRDEAIDPDHDVEVWFEKNGLIQLLKPIKTGLNISLWASKGFQSTNIMEQMVRRLRIYPVKTVLILSDYDSSGLAIPEDIGRRAKRLGIKTKFVRIGINPEQIPVERRSMSLKQLNKNDSRYKKFVAEHGTRAYEVDALSDEELRALVVSKLEELGIDLEKSVQERFKENQGSITRYVTEQLLYSLKKSMKRAALEKVHNYDTRRPTVEQLKESILAGTTFLKQPEELVTRIAAEIKVEFHIEDEPEDEEGEVG